ncbi:cyclic nucleotide-binding domain-containing protein [Leptospira sp. 96542]|nr:cyclic nucleotide-binding domain-containing protein [Leptospira sp. 96542]
MRKTFTLLTPEDWKVLLALATKESYEAGQIIISEGSEQTMLYLILEGFVHITGINGDSQMTFDRLGPNEVFGEMSFLENAAASASVIAEDKVSVEKINATNLNSLLASDLGFSSRFYNSLAISLSKRLRNIQMNQKELNINEIAQVSRFHSSRLGFITQRQIPEDLKNSIEEFDSRIRKLDDARNFNTDIDSRLKSVKSLCNEVIDLLNKYTQPETLVKMGFEDLLSFRDTNQLLIGIGAYIFRETFSRFMLSETIAHCYMKPRGFTDDFKVNELIMANQPWGDGHLGTLIDQWFLEGNFCLSRREDNKFMSDSILNFCKNAKNEPSLLSFASGSGIEFFNASQHLHDLKIKATMIDIDKEALEHANILYNKIKNKNHSISFINQNIMGIIEGRVELRISEQDFIYATGFCDYLMDEQIIELLNWIASYLKAGGRAIINVTSPEHPDRNFLTHILEWVLIYRNQNDLEKLISKSKFSRAKEFKTNSLGTTTFAILEK